MKCFLKGSWDEMRGAALQFVFALKSIDYLKTLLVWSGTGCKWNSTGDKLQWRQKKKNNLSMEISEWRRLVTGSGYLFILIFSGDVPPMLPSHTVFKSVSFIHVIQNMRDISCHGPHTVASHVSLQLLSWHVVLLLIFLILGQTLTSLKEYSAIFDTVFLIGSCCSVSINTYFSHLHLMAQSMYVLLQTLKSRTSGLFLSQYSIAHPWLS